VPNLALRLSRATAYDANVENVVVVLVHTEGALNLGSVARLCGNFGCTLRLVDVAADASCREAIMMAHPSEHVLANAARYATLREALVDVELAVGTSSKIASARDAPALDIERARAMLPSSHEAKVAFVFGNERTGMKLDEAALCQRVVRLETPGAEPSLNLSHAVAVVLEICALAALVDVEPRLREAVGSADAKTRRGRGGSAISGTRAGAAVKEHLLRDWLSILDDAGYFKSSSAAHFAPRMREIVDKMDVSERDVELVRGMLRFLADKRGAGRAQ
jgi:tRNA/rRNA methyltransferase